LLKIAFIRHHPEFAQIGAPKSGHYKEWAYSIVAFRYRDLNLCQAIQYFHDTKNTYKEHPEKTVFYKHRTYSTAENIDWIAQSISMSELIALVDREHLPAIIYMTDLAGLGFIFENSAEVEYFLLQRACALKYRCAEVQGRIGLLEGELSAGRQVEFKRDARDLEKTMWAHFPGYTKPAK
jgi:hypothetical protein